MNYIPSTVAALPAGRRRQVLAATLIVLASTLALWSGPSAGHEYKAGGLKIEHPWSRATAAGTSVGGGFMVIVNSGKADALVGASSPVAARVEMHSSSMEGGMMKMRQLQRVELPAGGTVRFEPGALHLMLIGLKQPLAEGSKVPLTLRFAVAGEQRVELKVESLGAQAKAMEHSGH